jgi:hypothetical protein
MAFSGLQVSFFSDSLEDRISKYATAISGDGSVVAGYYSDLSGTQPDDYKLMPL